MKYRQIGRSGLKVSEISLGGWSSRDQLALLDERSLTHLLHEAFERGVNSIDLADIYAQGEVEALYGRLLRGYPRHQLVLTTKCYWPMSQGINDRGLSRKHIQESITASLKRLQTDYLDLYLCQRFDPDTPLDETVRALGDAIRQGKILYWGVCGWSIPQIEEAIAISDQLGVPRPINHQLIYNLCERGIEHELLPCSAELGLGVSVWSPLAGGLLAHPQGLLEVSDQSETWQKPWRLWLDTLHGTQTGEDAEAQLNEWVERWVGVTKEMELSPAQLALAWTLRREEVATVIVGVSSTVHLQENLALYERSYRKEALEELDTIFIL